MAWNNPQDVMDMVQTKLSNNDALSSIRGVYGGVGLSIVLLMIYGMIYNIPKTLLFIGIFWSLYAVSRLITIWIDGPLGDFGINWLCIETGLGLMAFLIYIWNKK